MLLAYLGGVLKIQAKKHVYLRGPWEVYEADATLINGIAASRPVKVRQEFVLLHVGWPGLLYDRLNIASLSSNI